MTILASGRSCVNQGICKNIVRSFGKNNKGVAAVEFALVFIPFMMLILFTLECSRMIYLYATIDLSLSEASQRTSNSGRSNNPGNTYDYETAFRDAFKNNLKDMPLSNIGNDGQITVSVKYCQNIDQIIGDSCLPVNSKNNPLALYHVTYEYKPLFFALATGFLDMSMTRDIIHVQEYERFSIS